MNRRKALDKAIPNPETGYREALGVEARTKAVYLSIRARDNRELTRLVAGSQSGSIPLDPPGVTWQPVKYVSA